MTEGWTCDSFDPEGDSCAGLNVYPNVTSVQHVLKCGRVRGGRGGSVDGLSCGSCACAELNRMFAQIIYSLETYLRYAGEQGEALTDPSTSMPFC